MLVGVPKETLPGEKRVALVPAVVQQLTKLGLTVLVESGAGTQAGYPDSEFVAKGAQLANSADELWSKADVICQVNACSANPAHGAHDVKRMRPGQVVIGMTDPLGSARKVQEAAMSNATLFGLELIPRTTRAQAMDVLSSMATIAGYKAVLMAADRLPKMLPMSMTAAGTIKAAKVVVMGAGVAGLSAIATAKRLGAVVWGYDVRPAVKEQIESLGGKFVDLGLETQGAEDKGGYAKEQSEDFLRKQREALTKVLADADIVITTAAIPGKRSPILITKDMVAAMQAGAVIIDLGAERGGNCELTQGGKEIIEHGVTIVGPQNVPSSVPFHGSQLFAKNVATFLKLLISKEGTLHIDMSDDIVAATLLCKDGQIVSARVKELLAS